MPPAAVPAAPPGVPDARQRRTRRLPEALRYSAVVYLLTRIPVLGALIVYLDKHPSADLAALAVRWDGWWYVRLAASGYSTTLHPPLSSVSDSHHSYSDWAFFPGYPLVIRAVHEITQLPVVWSAILVALASGLLAVWAVYLLGEHLGGRDTGRTAALLVAAWPGTAVLIQPYSEGLFLAAAAGALLALLRERWLLAGILGAAASLTRPSGLAVIAAAGAVALVRLVRDRDPRPLAAPVIASTGIGSFLLYGWWRTGDLLIWRHAENLWAQKLDFGQALVGSWLRLYRHYGEFLQSTRGKELLMIGALQILGAVALVPLLAAIVVLRRRLTLPLAVYGAVTLYLILGYSAVGTRPRTVLALVPAFVWLAVWRPRAVRIAAWVLVPVIGIAAYAYLWRVTP